ncbi:Nicotinate-nucleotide pyrophosphorylase, carboxylating [Anaerohalosphaera lusitana]|uniref:Probable nicotinate-nucleotide pyrophosphorylase [carboxylating] n=1 Tax=Anaerohalosphaera lusitana TaxID=1936003 RepID=A0A1U9NLF5_9BACT|nr:carboxylating nicotinate-nucleotide diphosphorylase [Anaerohalosphaera lusitana]AQT68400.1 Nicotinate-nucleotide pyrophosphorylase, carboxylating [Anaerohalosphaera lusitana]
MMHEIDLKAVGRLIDLAVDEDYADGDPTSEITVAEDAWGRAGIVSREKIVVCGMSIVGDILGRYSRKLGLQVLVNDGEEAGEGDLLGVIQGPTRSLLAAERVVLNFLQRLCGISTGTKEYVDAVKGTKAKILDTRKTTPGWRELEKYAVRCGGGVNHRMNLGDGVLIKDNHVTEFGDKIAEKLGPMVARARLYPRVKFVGVEVDDVDFQLKQVLAVEGIDVVLLDNMSYKEMRRAVEMRNEMCGERPLLEASGNIRLENVREVAETGVERISVGALTHSAVSVDIGLDRE